MNYQHSFHVGNFADIFKHLILSLCLEKLHEKSSSFLALDTHSASAKYNILEQNLAKTNEFNNGFKKILENKNLDEVLPPNLLKILAKINVCEINELAHKFRFYAGSPLIIKNFLRAQDKAIFAETQHKIFQELRRNFVGNKKILCLQEDGFSLLKSKLPPFEKRALVMIDPSYEKNHNIISLDYELSIKSLAEGYKRCAHGIYLLWYPIIENKNSLWQNFYQKIYQLKFDKITQITFDIGKDPQNPSRMHACGMFIFNMPWQVDVKINFYLTKIINILKNSEESFFEIKNIK